MTESSHFAETAFLAGCPPDQPPRFVQAEVLPQPRQLVACAAARLCDLPDGPTAVGFGGARGGGKSFWLLAQMGLDDCQRFPGLKCLLLRKVGKANRENFDDLRRPVFHRTPHEFFQRGLLTFPNGSRIIAGHYQCEKDIDAYLGLEYDIIGIEEATTLTSRKHTDITTCCRSSKIWPDGRPWRPRIYSTTNPGGVGHAWYRFKYVDPYLDHQRRLNQSPVGEDVRRLKSPSVPSTLNPQLSTISQYWDGHTDTIFIPATINDNAFTNPGYRRVLDELTGWQKRAWRDGDWDIAAGQFFTNFRREVHVLKDFSDAAGVEWFAALDYGFHHYTVVLLGCRDNDGNIIVVDEHSARNWVPELHAQAIHAMLKRHRLSLSGRYATLLHRFVAGADVFARQSNGVTIAKQYADLGIHLRPANTDRVNGWAEILKRLGDPASSVRPSLFIHPRCTRLIDCLPSLQHDPARPEDVLKVDPDDDGIGGDDAADTLRYLVATKSPQGWVAKLKGL